MTLADADIAPAARNLFCHCAGLVPGARVLIVGESNAAPVFDPDVCRTLAAEARALGLAPEVRLTDATVERIPPDIVEAMQTVDATVFFSRLGGRARFDVPEVPGLVVNGHAETPGHLRDPFTCVDHRVQKAVHDALVLRIAAAEEYRITAPCGTDLRGTVPAARDAALVPFALEVFPVMIFPPVLCRDLSGSLVIDHFVTSSATRLYDDSLLMIDRP